MEQGDKYGLVGMILGLGAIADAVLYIVYSFIPFYDFIMPIMLTITYIYVFGGGSVGIILSSIGISKNGAKFGKVGLLTSIFGIIIFVLALFVIPM
ncbi:MAG TPA: hypothetical protein VMV49_13455 [Candidatus Deferrimicrobium sp.]|nr:hypothetical protein [Candidatus Deferrimicrobium sp.]